MIGCSIFGASVITIAIVIMFSIAGASEDGKKIRRVFSAPIASAARLINKRKGNITLVRRTVNENFSGILRNPGAIAVTIVGAKRMPIKQIKPTKIRIKVKVILTSLSASFIPCVVWYSVRTGIRAEDIEPSAKSSLKRFGILKATKKVSAMPVAPKNLAIIMSFT